MEPYYLQCEEVQFVDIMLFVRLDVFLRPCLNIFWAKIVQHRFPCMISDDDPSMFIRRKLIQCEQNHDNMQDRKVMQDSYNSPNDDDGSC